MSGIYCKRFASMIRQYADNQKAFAELCKTTPDVITRMKQSDGMLFAHLADIAENVPSFNFNYLMFGESPATKDEKKKILTLAEKIVKICK